MKNIFRFKQFEVDQTNCAMKINTDGVLLAALVENKNPKRILDIGTGTGVLALMMAQRFPKAQVDAVEIDKQSSATAGKNFQHSVFNGQLSVSNVAIEQFNNPHKYDLIITNPPFFVNDLKNQEEKKGIARHASEEFFMNLMAKVNELLNDEGVFWFILPVKQAGFLMAKANEFDLKTHQIIYLHSDITKPAFRYIVCLGRANTQMIASHFYIYEAQKVYTNAYKQLLKDFFLAI